MTNIQFKEEVVENISLGKIESGKLFVFDNNKSIRENIVDGELFKMIEVKEAGSIFNNVKYMRMSDKFEIVQRTGYYDVVVIEPLEVLTDEVAKDYIKCELSNSEAGDVFNINGSILTIFTDPVESKGMINVLADDGLIFKLSPDVLGYRLNRNIVLDI